MSNPDEQARAFLSAVYEKIAHGDDDHRQWLERELMAWSVRLGDILKDTHQRGYKVGAAANAAPGHSSHDARAETLAALVLWVRQCWEAEVKDRPIENIHRRTLDGTWKRVLAKLDELRNGDN